MKIAWKRVLIKTFIGLVAAGIGLTAYAYWLGRDGFCVMDFEERRATYYYFYPITKSNSLNHEQFAKHL